MDQQKTEPIKTSNLINLHNSPNNLVIISEIQIDYRESKLIEELELKGNLKFKKVNLEIGDIIFKKGEDIIFCFERKTISDLVSSIKDGRYHEQTKRILECIKPHQCCYLIEGKIPPLVKYQNLSISAIYGSIINKMIRDGIFIYQTNNISESSRFISEFGNRFLDGKLDFKDKGNTIHVQKPRKKGNISTPECFQNQLANIPTVSSVKIMSIMEKYKSMRCFILSLEEKENPSEYLEKFILQNGRKLGKSSAQKIIDFLGFN